MKKTLHILLCLPFFALGQTHSIDQHNLQMFGDENDADISINTYFNNKTDTSNISWNIIKDSLPNDWQFSICFPNCYAIGITTAQNLFYPNDEIYLNCHMYPNGQVGSGIIQMEITTNNLYKDTVTWMGYISSLSFTNELNTLELKNRKLVEIIDIIGKSTKISKNTPFFKIYDDGTVEKRIVID